MAKDKLNDGESKRAGWLNPFGGGITLAGRIWRAVLLIVVLYFICAPFVMWYEYNRAFPEFFNPAPLANAPSEMPATKTGGVVYSDTLITLGNKMLVAWLPNDVIYPSVLMDNPQNFQLGELEVLRYCTRVLRDKLSRQRTTDKIDRHADRAFTDFSNNPHLWIFPAAESKLADGVKSLGLYRQGLVRGTSHFYARADNLIELLDQFTSLLGGVDTRLANAPRDATERLSEETAGDSTQQGERRMRVAVPWSQIDDNFYFGRGVAYAMYEVMLAVRWEFRDVIEIKRSSELMDTIVEELRLAHFEPLVVLNGSRDSIFANHSLKLMATLENVRQKMINLQQMLER
ncbi:MAG: DUF2333 family protein [Desulfarculaceae bacterium]|nr:DUF2333 family protein [Desulfarculaceae bacterium]MCF8071086.1 DUF2333 family protein [Desulfarculaceae bacterium]MCF8100674.1 DUF2333 family protein [Desulfarculaceae bacterium]MCF8118072.1 DUF2333 family protein [Desulfarculaceae bacterium]